MAQGLQLPPPTLTGYSYIRPLGSGGFADVYLYDQNMPRRRVAVKVLRTSDMNPTAAAAFRAEANVLARVSSHPAILTIFEASIAPDGRPYIAMEHCINSYSTMYKTSVIPVAEVLRTAIKIGGALHTLHQSGLLHRDIKPSNILTTEFGLPVLADFGIASSLTNVGTDAVGMSVPWSAPEVINEETMGTIHSEVFAFAATIFTLFERHSPAQIPGGDNSRDGMAARVRAGKLQQLTRQDIPPAARDVITRALSKDPQRRPDSIAEVVAELQRAEVTIGIAPTTAEYGAGFAVVGYADDGDVPTSSRSAVAYETRRIHRPFPQFAAPQQDQGQAPAPRQKRMGLILSLVGISIAAVAIIVTLVVVLVK